MARTPSYAVAAADALAQAQTDPAKARKIAELVLGEVSDPETIATARYALGMALRAEYRLDEAQFELQLAADEALGAGFAAIAGRVLLSLSGARAMAGKMDEAFSTAARASEHLEGADLAACEAQMATFLYHQDRHEEAVAMFDDALNTIEEAGTLARLPLVLANRGAALAALGRLQEAQDSLERAWGVVGHDMAQAGLILSHLGWVAALRGELPAALRWFEKLEQSDVPGREDPGWLVDYAYALLESGLVDEASAVARRSLDFADAKGLRARRQIPLKILADAALRSEDTQAAVEHARAAVAALEELGASPLPARIRQIEAALADDPSGGDLDRLEDLISEIERTDRAGEALEARVDLALAAARLGLADRAEKSLPRRSLMDAPLRVQVQAWTALAYIRLGRGDRRGAGSALRAALRRSAVHRAAFGAADLRAASSSLGTEAAQLGLRLAVEDGRPARVLAWAERSRAAAQRTRPVLPAADREQHDLLARYRQVSDRIRKEEGPAPDLLRERTRLERRIRDHARTVGADGQQESTIPSQTEVRRGLGSGSFVEFLLNDGDVLALVVGPNRSRLVPLPGAGAIEEHLRSLDLAVARVLSDRSAGRALTRIESLMADLDERLIGPWRHLLGDEVTLNPAGSLHSIPWPLLPSLRDRAVSVAPSAAAWLRNRPMGSGPPVFVAGPDLEHAASEVKALQRMWPGAISLVGDEATVARTLESLRGASVAHLAAHGRFRTDNPMFTSLMLADGPLSLYDLEDLDQPPELVVLSACEAGSSVIRVGDELMGLAAAFLEMGSRTVIAPLFPVRDEATGLVMEIVHRHLAEGAGPAEALRAARASTTDGDRLAASSFICFGSAP